MILMISLDAEVKIGALFRLLERRIKAVEFARSNRIKIPLSKVLYVPNRICWIIMCTQTVQKPVGWKFYDLFTENILTTESTKIRLGA